MAQISIHREATQPRAADVLDALREATRPMHKRLESAPRLKRLIEPDLSRNEYCEVLERLLGYHEPAELAVKAHADRLPIDFGPRRKTHLLACDLERLRYSRRAIDHLPRCSDVVPVTDVDSALGVLYVLEGSTLTYSKKRTTRRSAATVACIRIALPRRQSVCRRSSRACCPSQACSSTSDP